MAFDNGQIQWTETFSFSKTKADIVESTYEMLSEARAQKRPVGALGKITPAITKPSKIVAKNQTGN